MERDICNAVLSFFPSRHYYKLKLQIWECWHLMDCFIPTYTVVGFLGRALLYPMVLVLKRVETMDKKKPYIVFLHFSGLVFCAGSSCQRKMSVFVNIVPSFTLWRSMSNNILLTFYTNNRLQILTKMTRNIHLKPKLRFSFSSSYDSSWFSLFMALTFWNVNMNI